MGVWNPYAWIWWGQLYITPCIHNCGVLFVPYESKYCIIALSCFINLKAFLWCRAFFRIQSMPLVMHCCNPWFFYSSNHSINHISLTTWIINFKILVLVTHVSNRKERKKENYSFLSVVLQKNDINRLREKRTTDEGFHGVQENRNFLNLLKRRDY